MQAVMLTRKGGPEVWRKQPLGVVAHARWPQTPPLSMRRTFLVVLLALVLPLAVAGLQVARALRQGDLAKPILGALVVDGRPDEGAVPAGTHSGSCALRTREAGKTDAVTALRGVGGDALAFAAAHPSWLKWKALTLENQLHAGEREALRLGELLKRATPLQRWALERAPLPDDRGSLGLAPPQQPPRPDAEPPAALAERLAAIVPEDFAGFASDDLGPSAQRAIDAQRQTTALAAQHALLNFASLLDEAVRATGQLSGQAPSALPQPAALLFPGLDGSNVYLDAAAELHPAVVERLRRTASAAMAPERDFQLQWTNGEAFGTGTLKATRPGSTAVLGSLEFSLGDEAWRELYRTALVARTLNDDPRLRVGPQRLTTRAWGRALRPELATPIERALRLPAPPAQREADGSLWVERWPVPAALRGTVEELRQVAANLELELIAYFKERDEPNGSPLPARDGLSALLGKPNLRVQWNSTTKDVVLFIVDGDVSVVRARYAFSESSFTARYWLALTAGTPDEARDLARGREKVVSRLGPEFKELAKLAVERIPYFAPGRSQLNQMKQPGRRR